MKAWFLRHKKLHLWLAANGLWLAVYFAIRGNRGWMNALSAHVTAPLRQWISTFTYATDVSVMEVLCILGLLLALGYLLWSLWAVLRAGKRRWQRAYTALLGGVCALLTFYSLLSFLWGMDSYTDSFQDRSGLTAAPVSTQALYQVTEQFAQGLAETADTVRRDEAGLFAESRAEILARSVHAYDAISQTWPFLAAADRPPKAVHFSRVMSALDFTGVYCPFTGESNVNMDSPACLLPATAAHELAHQRGFSSEQECNFLAIAAATTCGDPAFAYAGYLLGYIHLGNALYRADQTLWRQVYESLPAVVRADLDHNNAYWRQFSDTAVKELSNRIYDGYLKSNGQTQGLQSYGTVVDLLVAYYGDASA